MTAKHAGGVAISALVCWTFFALGAGTAWTAETLGQPPAESEVSQAESAIAGVESEGLVPQSEDQLSAGQALGPCIGSDDCPECNGDCAPACPSCMVGPSGRYWFRADYLLWWTRGPRVVPLVTTSSQGDYGIIGRPTTRILFGGDRVGGQSRSGARLVGGMWFDCGQTVGWQFDLFSLGEGNTHFSYTSSGDPLLARPYIDAQNNNAAAELVARTGDIRGNTNGDIDEYVHSAGVGARFNLCCCEAYCPTECSTCTTESCTEACTRAEMYGRCLGGFLRERFRPDRYRVDLVGGYRHYRLDETLRIREDLVVIYDPEIPCGTTYDIEDLFRSRNEFHGGELGLVAQFDRGPWSLELLAKMALGNNNQVVRIAGSTVITRPDGDTASYEGGLLTQPTNTRPGYYTRDEFVVIPQFGAEIGYQVTCRLRAYVGYNLLYWANVTRAAEQVDFTINTTQMHGETLVGPARPAFSFRDSDFWAQGLNFGAEYRF